MTMLLWNLPWLELLRYALGCVPGPSEANSLQSDSNGQLSILTVNKSKEPFPAQIAIVCKILGINLDVHGTDLLRSGGEPLPYQYNASDPRPQWALKWLLKNLQQGDIELNRSVRCQG